MYGHRAHQPPKTPLTRENAGRSPVPLRADPKGVRPRSALGSEGTTQGEREVQRGVRPRDDRQPPGGPVTRTPTPNGRRALALVANNLRHEIADHLAAPPRRRLRQRPHHRRRRHRPHRHRRTPPTRHAGPRRHDAAVAGPSTATSSSGSPLREVPPGPPATPRQTSKPTPDPAPPRPAGATTNTTTANTAPTSARTSTTPQRPSPTSAPPATSRSAAPASSPPTTSSSATTAPASGPHAPAAKREAVWTATNIAKDWEGAA